MNVRNLLLTALAASMALVSCDKSENDVSVPTDKSLKSVTLTLPNITKAVGSRATGDAMANNSQVELKNFRVYFVDGDGNEVTVPQYDGQDQQVYFSDDATDSWEAIGVDGRVITYHFLPATTAKVVVVGNIGGDVEYADLATRTENVLNDSQDGYPLYPLYGYDDLAEKNGTADDKNHENVYTATVTLAPHQSRFEIFGFEYVEATGSATNDYESIELQKIALNHYYVSYDFVSKDPSATGSVFDNPSHEEAWNWIEARTAWCDDLDLTIEPGQPKFVNGTDITDENEDGEDATGIITYGLAHVADKANNPELLLALHGTTTAGTSVPLYLRGKFTGDNQPNFEAGKIYRVFFAFTDADLQQPERCVELTVEVANWTVVTVTPEFNN